MGIFNSVDIRIKKFPLGATSKKTTSHSANFCPKSTNFDNFKLIPGLKKSGTFWENTRLRPEGGGGRG